MSHYVVGVEEVGGPATARAFDKAKDAILFLDRWKDTGAKVTVFRDGKPIEEEVLRKVDQDERTLTSD